MLCPRQLLWLSLPFCLSLACGSSSEDEGFDAEKAPYGAYTLETKNGYTQQTPSGPEENVTTVLGEKTINGKAFTRYHIGVKGADPQTEGAEFWASQDGDDVELAGFEAKGNSWIFPSGKGLQVTFETPIPLNLAPPAEQEQTFSASATGTIEGDATTYAGEVSGTYTMVSSDATVETAAGSISGCRHFVGTLSPKADVLSGILNDVVLDVEIWYHPSFGPVAASIPTVGWSIGLKESADCGTAQSGFQTIRKMAIIDEPNGLFKLDTYDCSGTFDADKDVHAKMLLELRWLDPDKAKTDDEPGYPAVTIDFGTVWGSFPAQLVKSPVSIFYPEENGEGYTYWLAFVDQAAKNEAENGIAYHIEVNADTDITPPLRATARIYYKLFP